MRWNLHALEGFQKEICSRFLEHTRYKEQVGAFNIPFPAEDAQRPLPVHLKLLNHLWIDD